VINAAQGVVLIPGYTNNALIRCTDINGFIPNCALVPVPEPQLVSSLRSLVVIPATGPPPPFGFTTTHLAAAVAAFPFPGATNPTGLTRISLTANSVIGPSSAIATLTPFSIPPPIGGSYASSALWDSPIASIGAQLFVGESDAFATRIMRSPLPLAVNGDGTAARWSVVELPPGMAGRAASE
jgi:hypothetical protein